MTGEHIRLDDVALREMRNIGPAIHTDGSSRKSFCQQRDFGTGPAAGVLPLAEVLPVAGFRGQGGVT